MLKKTTLCLFALVLLLGAGNVLVAEQPLKFTVSTPVGTIEPLTEENKVNLRNAAELTDEELKAALEKSSCSGAIGEKSPTACVACEFANCTGRCYLIPCGFYINAKDQTVPPPPPTGFLSFVSGCANTYVSTCNDLGTAPGCSAAVVPGAPELCYTSSLPLQSVGCI